MIELGADMCAQYAPFVYGGQLDPWTVVAPGAWDGDAWPCPGVAVGADVARTGEVVAEVRCTCPCHNGGPQHELPPRRTAVHPTEVLGTTS